MSIVTTILLGVSISYVGTLDILKYKSNLAPKDEGENKVGEVEGEQTKSKIIGHHMFNNNEEDWKKCHEQALEVSRKTGIPVDHLIMDMCRFDRSHGINNLWYFF